MGALLAISRAIDALNTFIGRHVSWLILAAVVVSAGNAIVRKAYNWSSNSLLETQWYLFGAVFMLAAPYALLKNEHIRIDILASRLSRRARDRIEIFGHVAMLLPLTVIMSYLTWTFFYKAFTSGEMSGSEGGLVLWPARLAIFAGFVLLLLQAISELIKRIAVMRGLIDDPHRSRPHGSEAHLGDIVEPKP